MKALVVATAAVLALGGGAALAQPSGMSGMGMKAEKGMDTKGETKGEMKGMEGMDHKSMKAGKKGAKHKASGTVKKVDPQAGTVTLAHGPVKSLKWPAMTMDFKVTDKAMLEKLTEGKKVKVEFVQQGKEYVITSAK